MIGYWNGFPYCNIKILWFVNVSSFRFYGKMQITIETEKVFALLAHLLQVFSPLVHFFRRYAESARYERSDNGNQSVTIAIRVIDGVELGNDSLRLHYKTRSPKP